MNRKHESLFTPFTLKNLQLKNRLVMAPITTGLNELGELGSQRYLDFYEKSAAGGVGMIITGALA